MAGFTKLDPGIVDSSIWAEPPETRIVWITLLAKCDKTGYARLSMSGLQRASNIPIKKVSAALKTLEGPDSDSRTPDNEGRRVRKIDGGWHVLNYELYRENMMEQVAKEYLANEKRKQRALKDSVQTCLDKSRHVPDTSASASVSVSVLEGESPGPKWDECQKWLAAAKKNGADYKESECRSAWLALSANGWRWGRNPVTDWRSALERQIQTDKERKTRGTNTDKPNPRNVGVYKGITDYGEAARRKAEGASADSKKVVG